MSQPPNQPYPGQPHPEQPGAGQPDYPPTQPYPNQAGHPYQGRPNPDVPTSVPPQPGFPPQPQDAEPTVHQPGYPQPGYAQPGYPQPGQAQPGYPQPGQAQPGQAQPGYPQPGQAQAGYPQPGQAQAGYPQPGQAQAGYPQPGQAQAGYPQPGYPQSGPPMPGFPAPPKAKSKALPIILMSIAVVLVLCVGGSTVIYLASRNTAKDIADALATPTPTPTVTTDAPPSSTITVVEPKTFGGRPKLTDPKFAAAGEQLKLGPGSVRGATETIGALYGTVKKRDIVIVAAAAAPVEDPESELESSFTDAGVDELKLTGISLADPGRLGGVAKCGKGEAGGAPLVICGWADEGSLGWVIWYFTSLSKAKGEFPKLREQVEKKSN